MFYSLLLLFVVSASISQSFAQLPSSSEPYTLSVSTSSAPAPLTTLPSVVVNLTLAGSNSSLNLGIGIPSRACGTGEPSTFLLELHAQLRDSPPSLIVKRNPKIQYTVETYFHIVSTNDSKSMVTSSMIANQFGMLQQAYASANISFTLMGVDSHVNDSWATDAADSDMKNALRKGNYSTLNVYFQTNLSTPQSGSQLLGYCSLPQNVTYSPCSGCPLAEVPESYYASDGCNVLAGSMPGGNVTGYNLGKTAIHEIGHWFGLLHTFQDNSCSSSDSGDYINDTPQEGTSTSGCPSYKDSCPSLPGLDPINNFMDYSSDACYTNFTLGQTQRMLDIYKELRFGN